MRVWLTRQVTVCEGKYGNGHFVRAVDLPIEPFPGLGLVTRAGADPYNVVAVYVNECGAVVVEMEHELWAREDFDLARTEAEIGEEAKQQFEWETAGWRPIGPLAPYRLDPPSEADVTPLAFAASRS